MQHNTPVLSFCTQSCYSSLTQREEHGVERVRELGAEGDIWAEEGRGNRGVELHDLYSPNIIRLIKSRRRGAENVARTGRVFW